MFCLPLIAYTILGTYAATVIGITWLCMSINSSYGVSFTNNLQQLTDIVPIAAKIPLVLVGVIDSL